MIHSITLKPHTTATKHLCNPFSILAFGAWTKKAASLKIYLNENILIPIQFLPIFVNKSLTHKKSSLVRLMTWCGTDAT